MISYHKIQQNTARIDRTAGNPAIYGDIVRSVLTAIITRASGFIARSPQIATADLTYGVGALAGLSYPAVLTRAVRSVGRGDTRRYTSNRTENHGVPGSNPGPATPQKTAACR